MLLSVMPFPVLRSMMSKIISKAEQGEWLQSTSPFVFSQFTKSAEMLSASSASVLIKDKCAPSFGCLGQSRIL